VRRGTSSRARPAASALAAIALALSLAPGASAADPSAAGGAAAPRFTHIIVVVMENQSFDDIFEKNPAAHYILDELTPQATVATRFFAPKRNSPTTYFAMSSGFTYTEGDGGRWAGKCNPSPTCSADDQTVYEQLVAAGGSWRIYSEDQAEPCQTTFVDKYWVGHNPAVWFRQLGPNSYTESGDGTCRANDLGFDAMRSDFASGAAPAYSLVVPDNCHNMHDACYPVHDRVQQGDAWLRDAMAGDELVAGGLVAWARANDALLVITYDEARLDSDREGCCPYRRTGGGGHIPTWLIGPTDKIAAGATSDVPLSNFSILRTVEENWDLPLLGHRADPETASLDALLVPAASRPPVAAFPAGPAAGARSATPSRAPTTAPASAAAPARPVASPAPLPVSTAAASDSSAAWLGAAGVALLAIVAVVAIILVRRPGPSQRSSGLPDAADEADEADDSGLAAGD